ncbi:MAG: DNA repair protein RecO [Mogibacterium sp.]|nr:DNA repair protein RecO [Mogibacterium sp.]
MLVSTDGIVLKQRKIANNRRMIVIFSKQYGKISAGTSINEKSRTKAALALRPFTYAEYDLFRGRETYSINSASVRTSYFSIGEEIERFETASVLINYLDSILQEGEAMPGLFDLALECLETISGAKGSCETVLYAFIVKSLRMLGVMPELGACVGCGRGLGELGTEHPMFSVTSGGIICAKCAAGEKTEGNALIYRPAFDIIEVFRFFLSRPLGSFAKVSLKGRVAETVRNIISDYISRYLGSDVLRNSIRLEV